MLYALTPAWADEPARSFLDMVQKVALVPAGTHDTEMLARVTVAVNFIKRLELPKAHVAVNEALQLDARNSYLLSGLSERAGRVLADRLGSES